MRDEFLHRKEQILSKSDKSFKQEIDEPISTLCELFNKTNMYYTTSSCSGRIVIRELNVEKRRNVFLYSSHRLIGSEELDKLSELIEHLEDELFAIEICQEGMIIHIVCKDLEIAQELLKDAKDVGCNQVGIISIKNWGIVVECICDLSMSSIIFEKNFLSTNPLYLKQLTKKMNGNMKKNWKVIERFENLIKGKLKKNKIKIEDE